MKWMKEKFLKENRKISGKRMNGKESKGIAIIWLFFADFFYMKLLFDYFMKEEEKSNHLIYIQIRTWQRVQGYIWKNQNKTNDQKMK